MPTLKHVAAASVLVVALLAPAGPAGAEPLTTQERALLFEMNRARKAHGLGLLRLDRTLQRAARSHSLGMLRTGVFAHGAFAERMKRFRARGPVLAENLAWGAGTQARARTFVHMWLESPTHRRNLLRPGFARVGIASVTGSFSGYADARVVTADFAGR